MLPPSTPDLLALDLLDSVAELGSFGQAAVRHRMSQPAVSMRMRHLERRLGVTLLLRTPSGTRLTPAGDRVVALSRRVLGEARALMDAVDALVTEERSRLNIAASLTVAEHLLPGWLAALHRESPEVILSVEVTNSATVLGRVRGGDVDVGFVEGHERELPDMETAVVRSDRLLVVVHPGHPWAARRSPVPGAELAGTEFVVRELGSGTREVLEDALRPWGGLRSRLELGSISSILAAVQTAGVDLSRSLRVVWRADWPLPSLARRLLTAASA